MLKRFKIGTTDAIIDLSQIESIQTAMDQRTLIVFRSSNTEYITIPFEEMVNIWWEYQAALSPIGMQRP